jgi:ParB-like chromosome segregation protein Spo0J
MATGMDLKLERVAARVQMRALAKQMGRSRATVHRYEGLAVVPPGVVAEYRAALRDIADIATPEGEAA